MAFLHTHTNECTLSQLDLFTIPPTQTSIESTQWIEYKPVTAISEDSYLEFVVPGNSDEYIDLAHTMLHVSVRLEKNNAVIGENELVAPVNNFCHSMFGQIDVYLNNKCVSQPNAAYPYRAYIETLLNYSDEAKKSHLTSALWYDDTPGHMNAELVRPDGNDADALNRPISTNDGASKRNSFVKGGKVLDMISHLHCDVFNQEKFLLNGVEMRVRLIRSKDAFCLMDFENAPVKVHILDAALRVRRAKINPAILLGHTNALTKGTAKYPLSRVEMKNFVIHAGVTGESLDNIILGQIPKRIIVGLVSNKAFNGNRKENPFNFQHFNLTYLALNIDGVQVPSKALQPKFPDTFIDAYHTLISGTGIHFLNEGNCISRDNFSKGYCLFAFDLTPDLSANCNAHWQLVKTGAVRLELRFENALAEPVNCLIHAEYDSVLDIDSARHVILDSAH